MDRNSHGTAKCLDLAPDDVENQSVPLVSMTHTAATGNFRVAIANIDRLAYVAAPSLYFPVAD